MNTLIERLLTTRDDLGQLALRLPLGAIFIAHGAQKLFGSFGGYGLEGTGQYMASLGLNPGYLMALMAGSAEFFGGVALVVGLLVRPAGMILSLTMLVAIVTAHLGNGLFMSNGGYEFALALLAGSIALAANGAGGYSLDRLIINNLSSFTGQEKLGRA
ncbi:MAG: DoxX family protein [Gammaproteobacteria bacterium]|nr:DoxX family protein [Pseudomonadales bacterium]MCP5347214.1 DoxX family protein [Pseudomonadales bacterium]